jgi:DNA transposition AAA+ family ATPase
MNKFISTKQYKQFAEFCRACERDNYIGLCYGSAGAGKTESARHYSKWYQVIKHFDGLIMNYKELPKFPTKNLNTILYTPSQLKSSKDILREINVFKREFGLLKERGLYGSEIPFDVREKHHAKMIIIDESERLKPESFELIREMYDAGQANFIFIGMPGIEKTMSRFPQLYSRIGFVHQFKNMGNQELKFILENHLGKLNYNFKDDDYNDQEVISTVLRITNGNFRLVDRVIKQAIRIMKVNCMTTITKEIIEAARSCLLIGEK